MAAPSSPRKNVPFPRFKQPIVRAAKDRQRQALDKPADQFTIVSSQNWVVDGKGFG